MKYLILLTILVSCSGQVIKSGSFERDSKRNYTVRVGAESDSADDTFLRAAYEICRIYHRSGVNILSKQIMSPPQMKPWIEGVISCSGAPEQALEDLYSSSREKIVIKKAEEEGWSFTLDPIVNQ